MIIAGLILLGLCLGSFINAFVWRLHKQETEKNKTPKKYSILKGRSICVHCEHQLATKDLIPLLSWLALSGKCRYCKQPISPQYPLVEAGTAAVFVFSYVFWPDGFDATGTVGFVFWLIALTGSIALIVYDLKWMLLPNKIVFGLIPIAFIGVLLQAILTSDASYILSSFWGAVIGGGIFYILFQISDGRWIGGGDVKLGFLLGIIVGGPFLALLLLFIACFLGSLLSLPLLASGKADRRTRIPFGPFLIAAAIIVRLFGEQLADGYSRIFLG